MPALRCEMCHILCEQKCIHFLTKQRTFEINDLDLS